MLYIDLIKKKKKETDDWSTPQHHGLALVLLKALKDYLTAANTQVELGMPVQ